MLYLNSIFKGCFFVLKEKFTILHVLHIGFLCYLDSDEILL